MLAPDADIAQAKVLGRKFTVMYMLWLYGKKHAFTTLVDDNYNDLKCFETEADKIQGQLADLHVVLSLLLGKKLDMMEKDGLADAVSSSPIQVFVLTRQCVVSIWYGRTTLPNLHVGPVCRGNSKIQLCLPRLTVKYVT
jgi:hypothetical protein